MILSAQSIRARKGMIDPFLLRSKSNGVSHGLSACGYDVRTDQHITLQPGQSALISTVEKFTMPADVVGFVTNKSTWMRRGLSLSMAVLEPGWIGHLSLRLYNHGVEAVQIIRGTGIAQIIFTPLDEPTEMAYSATDKYQNAPAHPQEAILADNDLDDEPTLPGFITGRK
jgi:dCTP deaminase